MARIVTAEEIWPLLKPWTRHCAGDVMRREGLELPAPAAAPTTGMRLCVSDGRTVAIGTQDMRMHTHVIGPIGSGKSWLLANMALDVIKARTAATVIVDPKDGQLISNILERIPREDWDRVVLIEPHRKDRAVALNVLEAKDPALNELVADQVVEIVHQLYPDSWGARLGHVLRAAVLTLMHAGNATLCDLPDLLQNKQARAHWTRTLDDPIGLGSFWAEYEKIGDAGRAQWCGPLIYKLREILLNRNVRHLFGQARSTINLEQILNNKGILLVNLPPGELGPVGQMVGALLVARIWQVIQARSAMPEDQRPETVALLDEFSDILRFSADVRDIIVKSRAYHFGLVLAHQHLGQLPDRMKGAVGGNVRTKVAFQAQEAVEAKALEALFPGVAGHEFLGLRPHQVVARLCSGGHSSEPFTGFTLPLEDIEPEGRDRRARHAAELADKAMERWGRDRQRVEHEQRERFRKLASRPASNGSGNGNVHDVNEFVGVDRA